MQGVTKFVHAKGFAFVGGDDGIDVFCHPSMLRRAGLTDLKIGDRVQYERLPSRRHEGKFEADRITRLPDATRHAATSAPQQCPECDQLHGRHAHYCAFDEAA